MVKIFLADDHKVLRRGLRLLIEAEADLKVAGEAVSGDEAIDMLRQLCPDVLIADLRMPGLSGIELARRARELCPGTATIILSMYGDEAYILEALAAGAKGYILKESSAGQLITAIREALAGRCFVSPAANFRQNKSTNRC